jgi:protein O-GlcNAc transferase
MEAYNAALAIAPGLADVRTNLGDLWRAQGDSGRAAALACYGEVLQREPLHAPAWRGLGDVHREGGEHTQAAACYQEALRLQPHNADAHTGLGAALKELGRRSEAEAEFAAVVALRPKCALALGNLAGVYYDQVGGKYVCLSVICGSWFVGCWQVGCLHCLAAVSGMPSLLANGTQTSRLLTSLPCAYGLRLCCIVLQGKLEDAISSYRRAITAQPQFPEAYNNLGNALREAGRPEEAITCYTACIQLQMAAAQAPLLVGRAGLVGAAAKVRNHASAILSVYACVLQVCSLCSPIWQLQMYSALTQRPCCLANAAGAGCGAAACAAPVGGL